VKTDGRELEHQGDGLFGSLLLQRPEQPDDIFRLLYGIAGLPERDHRDLPFGIKLVVSSDSRFLSKAAVNYQLRPLLLPHH